MWSLRYGTVFLVSCLAVHQDCITNSNLALQMLGHTIGVSLQSLGVLVVIILVPDLRGHASGVAGTETVDTLHQVSLGELNVSH